MAIFWAKMALRSEAGYEGMGTGQTGVLEISEGSDLTGPRRIETLPETGAIPIGKKTNDDASSSHQWYLETLFSWKFRRGRFPAPAIASGLGVSSQGGYCRPLASARVKPRWTEQLNCPTPAPTAARPSPR